MNPAMRRFCRFYAQSGDPESAAIEAGYADQHAHRTGARFLALPEIRREVERLGRAAPGRQAENPPPPPPKRAAKTFPARRKPAAALPLEGGEEPDIPALVLAALRRLAFEEDRLEPNPGAPQADFFRVSEASLSGDGKISLKFYDRFKALQMLCEIAGRQAGGGGTNNLCRAIEAGIAAVRAGGTGGTGAADEA